MNLVMDDVVEEYEGKRTYLMMYERLADRNTV